MKTLLLILLVMAAAVGARAYPPAPASQAQVNAGTEPYLYVTPATLGGYVSTQLNLPTTPITGGLATNFNSNFALNGYDYPSNYTSIRQTYANAQTSNTTECIVFIGDSHICSYGANGGSGGVAGYTNAATHGMLYYLSQMLGGLDDGNMGQHTGGTPFTNYDSRCLTNTWTLAGQGNFVGGPTWQSSATADLVYQPDGQINELVIWYFEVSGNGVFDVVVDGVTNKQINTAAATVGTTGTNIFVATGTHTIDLKCDNGYVALLGFAYLNTNKPFNIINGGWDGSTATNWATPGYGGPSPLDLAKEVSFLPNPIVVCDLGNNDYATGQTLTQCSNNLVTIATPLANAGIPFLQLTSFAMSGVPLETNGWATMQRNVAHSMTGKQSSGYVYGAYADINQIWGGFNAAANAGLMYNSAHPDGQGYYLGAQFLAPIFQPYP